MQSEIISAIKTHFDTLLAGRSADPDSDSNVMWPAVLDIHTCQTPTTLHPDMYHPPGSANLYRDQPHLVAAHALTSLTGDSRYADAADNWIKAFLKRSVTIYGLFLWGNHYCYDARQQEHLCVSAERIFRPAGVHIVTAYLHELRPIPPAWALFWRINPDATGHYIRAMARYHIVDPATGAYNRHADQQAGRDYLEVGGLLVESLAWLYTHVRERSQVDLALKIARFSAENAGRATDLPRIASMETKRWERYTSTTEVGLWAGSLLRAARYTGLSQFRSMARVAVAAYLRYAWDGEIDHYYGRINALDGTPLTDVQITPYQPDTYADIWNHLFPAHDYPLALAETCINLYEQAAQEPGQKHEFRVAIQRWADIIAEHTYDNVPDVRYAEQFGRAIHFLLRAADVLGDNRYRVQAVDLADIALNSLFTGRMFRGHTGADYYDAADGVGFLLLALLYLETGQQPNYMGFGF